MKFSDLTEKLQAMTAEAEDFAIASLQEGVAFSPFIFYGEKKIVRIIADDIDQAIDEAHDIMEDSGEESAIFVYHDIIDLKDSSFDAIVTQIHDEDEDTGYSFALVYRIIDNKMQFLNERISLGEIRNALFL